VYRSIAAGAVLLAALVLFAVGWWTTPPEIVTGLEANATALSHRFDVLDPTPFIVLVRVVYSDGSEVVLVPYDDTGLPEPTQETTPQEAPHETPIPETTEIPPATATPDAPVQYGRVTAVNGLNVRAGPEVNAARIGALSYGHCTRLYDETDGWWQIDYADQVGWISGAWVQVLEACPVVWIPSPAPTATRYVGMHAIPIALDGVDFRHANGTQ
jgi:hypothetical protein